ncbi:hypothetical protein ACWDTP_22070 [Mycobacterium sp. NPDC003449]
MTHMLWLYCVLAVFTLVCFAVAVRDGQAWCERYEYRRHRED